jgi:heme A synthase
VSSAILLFVTAAFFWRAKGISSLPRMTLGLASVLMLFQIGLGDVVIGADLQPALVALHQASAIAIFGLVVVTTAWRNNPP